mmetsp:Transcript_59260/g.86740  ORF Transcript_59260/g.86740 Transcript_59260/m.86740 type:complete len:209 (+) Transcript_59260:102-728(+)
MVMEGLFNRSFRACIRIHRKYKVLESKVPTRYQYFFWAAKPLLGITAAVVIHQGYKEWGTAKNALLDQWKSQDGGRKKGGIGGTLEKENLLGMFDKIDADNSGEINAEELQKALKEAGHDVSMVTIQAMMLAADKDKDGHLSEDEWVEIMQQSGDTSLSKELLEVFKTMYHYNQISQKFRKVVLEPDPQSQTQSEDQHLALATNNKSW